MAKKKATDILSLIEADHEKVHQLFKEIENANSTKKTQTCFNRIYKELTLHTQAEELVFYPALREFEETEDLIEEAEEEHDTVKVLLEQMKSSKPDSAEFETQLTQLKEAVLHHLEEEETEIFATVRECMDEEDIQSLGKEFQEAKVNTESSLEETVAST